MKKSLLFIALSCFALSTVLSGCGSTRTTEEKPAATAETTDAQASDSTEDASEKTERDGFDEATNQVVELGNLQIAVPDYFAEDTEQDDESTYVYYAEKGDTCSMLQINAVAYDDNGNEIDDIIQEAKSEFFNGLVESMTDSNIGDSSEMVVAGYKAISCSFTGVISEVSLTGTTVFVADTDAHCTKSLARWL